MEGMTLKHHLKKDKIFIIRAFSNILYEDMLKNLESKFSPNGVPRNLPFLGPLPGGDGDAYLLEVHLLLDNGKSHNVNCIEVPKIDMLGISGSSTSVSSMTNLCTT